MHKPQKCTLELELPVERTGAVHGVGAVLLVAGGSGQQRTQPALWVCTLGSAAFNCMGRRPPPLQSPQAASAQQGHLRVCVQPLSDGGFIPGTEGGGVEITGRFSDLMDGTLCRLCAHSMPRAFIPGRHSETPEVLHPLPPRVLDAGQARSRPRGDT